MPDGTCIHNWCERQFNHGPVSDDQNVHEAQMRTVYGKVGGVTVQVSYTGGEREALIYVSDAELTVDTAEQLIEILSEQVKLARSVQPTPALVAG